MSSWLPYNLMYLAHYILRTDYRALAAYRQWVCRNRRVSGVRQALDMLACSVRHSTSFEDYYTLRLFDLDDMTRSTYAGTGAVHRFHRAMNAASACRCFRSKEMFYSLFRQFMGRECLFLTKADPDAFSRWISDYPVIVAKPDLGTQGRGVTFIDVTRTSHSSLYRSLRQQGLTVLEEPIKQHAEMQRLNPSCVNTVRVVTVRSGNQVDIIGSILRLGVGGEVDNLSAGGIAAEVDTATGVVTRPAISKAIWADTYTLHPVTQEPLVGFQVPYWESVLRLVDEAARVVPSVRTVGWDVAVTPHRAMLVEGNDNWNKNVWQLPAGEGRLAVLRQYADV